MNRVRTVSEWLLYAGLAAFFYAGSRIAYEAESPIGLVISLAFAVTLTLIFLIIPIGWLKYGIARNPKPPRRSPRP